jgi:hypothetical protein
MAGKVHQDMDSVLRDSSGGFLIAQVGYIDPVCLIATLTIQLVRVTSIVITIDFESAFIVMTEYVCDDPPYRVSAEISGHVANSQF